MSELPNKPRGVPRVNARRVLNGIFWVLRSGASWRDLPQSFGPLCHLLQSLCSLAPGAHAPVQEPSTASIAYIGRRHDWRISWFRWRNCTEKSGES